MNDLEMRFCAAFRLEQLRLDAAEMNRSRVLVRGWRSRLATALRAWAARLEPELRSNPPTTAART